jgi:predicted esterase
MIERSIRTDTHGRYLVAGQIGKPLLVGFHGYAEAADIQFERLKGIDGSDDWLCVSIQGLHRFYRGRTNDVVASWMTRQDRLRAIADNNAYVATVVDAVVNEWSAGPSIIMSGFSQGVAMAFRAAVASARPVSGVVACGGDVPPEIEASDLKRVKSVLLGRGARDEWYTPEKAALDERRLRDAGVTVQVVTFDGAHEWPAEFSRAAAEFLRSHR